VPSTTEWLTAVDVEECSVEQALVLFGLSAPDVNAFFSAFDLAAMKRVRHFNERPTKPAVDARKINGFVLPPADRCDKSMSYVLACHTTVKPGTFGTDLNIYPNNRQNAGVMVA
jgi:hypothetical protein